MADRNWGTITRGETFEALVTTIVFFEDPRAALFGRRGKDGGQDARSGDGRLVFQAKHHEGGSASAAIRDAINEAEQIRKYRDPSHARHAQWAGVTHWRLVTNSEFNPSDKLHWDTRVAPRFEELGLIADYWERANLDGLLDKHPEIHRSFFGNQTRVFLSIPEVLERLPAQEPFLRREQLGPFCGRATEKQEIRGFLASEKHFLVVHGAGGTGKTRLLVDSGSEIAGDSEWQVLWANVESLATNGAWFEGIIPERATLLLLDEPPDEGVLQQLAEQLGGRVGRAAKWKVVVSVRSTNDPVLRFIRRARIRPLVQELRLERLPRADAEEMCFQLLSTGRLANRPEGVRRAAARQIGEQFARLPVWLTLAIKHLEDHGDLHNIPADVEGLADEYLVEIENSQPAISSDSIREMLRWVALIGTVNRQDGSTVKLLGQRCGLNSDTEVRERLATLVQRGALVERGAHNRFVELKPDVLRDHVLLRWLARDTGAPRPEVSDDGKVILENVRDALTKGELSGLGRAILVTLARTEFILRHANHEFDLLGGFFRTLEASVPTMSTAHRVALTDTLEKIAHFRPRAVVSITAVLRRTASPDETIDGFRGPRVMSQADVVLSLAWPLFSAAMGAQTTEDKELVLRELCELAAAEAELVPSLPRGLPNDGRRAAALVTSVLEGGPQFWSEYDDTASQICTELIDALTRQAPSRGQVALLDALVRPLLKSERRQTWADEHFIKWRTFAVAHGSAAWTARETVLAQLKRALRADGTPSESRAQLWRLFARAQDGGALERLRWTYEVLSGRTTEIGELSAAREVWDWHRRFEQEPEIKAAAENLEALYASNELASEFGPLLLTIEDSENAKKRADSKALELSTAPSPDFISAFIDRAERFLRSDTSLFPLHHVAWSLGQRAESSEVVRHFIEGTLAPPSIAPRVEFGIVAAVSWVGSVRKATPDQAIVLVRSLLVLCGSDERRAHLLERIYGRVPRLYDVGTFTNDERELLRSSRDLFARTGRQIPFIAALALFSVDDWPMLQPCLERALGMVAPSQSRQAFQTLVNSVYWAVHDSDAVQLPVGLAEWLLTQLLPLPDLDEVDGEGEWRLNAVLRRTGKPGLAWLPEALRRRQVGEVAGDDTTRFRAVGHSVRLSKYIRQISAADATDSDVLAAVGQLLDLSADGGSVGYYLPEILHDVDPEGLVVPGAVVVRAQSTFEAEGVRRLARIAAVYPINTPPWRAIAVATVVAAKPHGAEAERSVYDSLGRMGVRSWSGARGEVPSIFASAVADARAALDAETQLELRPFWLQRLSFAEAELLDQQEQAKEERGE